MGISCKQRTTRKKKHKEVRKGVDSTCAVACVHEAGHSGILLSEQGRLGARTTGQQRRVPTCGLRELQRCGQPLEQDLLPAAQLHAPVWGLGYRQEPVDVVHVLHDESGQASSLETCSSPCSPPHELETIQRAASTPLAQHEL
jgi:hypothetical protein